MLEQALAQRDDPAPVVHQEHVGTAAGLEQHGERLAIGRPGVGVVSLVEGMALPANVIDNPAGAGSLTRLPNGQDSNNAATDWWFTGAPAPGAANVP